MISKHDFEGSKVDAGMTGQTDTIAIVLVVLLLSSTTIDSSKLEGSYEDGLTVLVAKTHQTDMELANLMDKIR